MKKKLSLVLCFVLAIGLLSGCAISPEPITAETASGLWDKVFVLPLASFITLLYKLLANNFRDYLSNSNRSFSINAIIFKIK